MRTISMFMQHEKSLAFCDIHGLNIAMFTNKTVFNEKLCFYSPCSVALLHYINYLNFHLFLILPYSHH